MFPFFVEQPATGLVISVEPGEAPMATVRVIGPDGDLPPFLTTFTSALRIATGLAKLPAHQLKAV